MKISISIVLSLLFSLAASAQYNFESCYAFWELTDSLRAGTKPSDSTWESLKNTEGYRRKNIPEAFWQEFKELVILVYTPGNAEQIAKRSEEEILLPRIVRYAQEEEELKAFVHQIENLHLMDSALYYARQYLPVQYQNCFATPTMYFLLLDYGGNANEDGINMDLLVSYDVENFRTGVFSGHEVFHYAIDKCRIKRLKKEFLPQHEAVVNAVELISEEGTGDIIDKPWILFHQDSPHMLKDTILYIYDAHSAKSIEGINLTLEALADGQNEPYSTNAHWQSLMLLNSHIPSIYMGMAIKKNDLEDELISDISNPFNFFYLYNEAAKRGRGKLPVFSSKAIDYLKLLESFYLVKEK